MTRVVFISARPARTCPLCRSDLHAGVASCGSCATPYHRACLVALGGCATLGCAALRSVRRARASVRRARARPGHSGRRAWLLAVTLDVLLLHLIVYPPLVLIASRVSLGARPAPLLPEAEVAPAVGSSPPDPRALEAPAPREARRLRWRPGPARDLLELAGERLRVHAALLLCVEAGQHVSPADVQPRAGGCGGGPWSARDAWWDGHRLWLEHRLDAGPDPVRAAREVVAIERALGVRAEGLREALLRGGDARLNETVERWALGGGPTDAERSTLDTWLAAAGPARSADEPGELLVLQRRWDELGVEAALRERELLLVERLRAGGVGFDGPGWWRWLAASDPHAEACSVRRRLVELGEDPCPYQLSYARRSTERPLAHRGLARQPPFGLGFGHDEEAGPTPTQLALARRPGTPVIGLGP